MWMFILNQKDKQGVWNGNYFWKLLYNAVKWNYPQEVWLNVMPWHFSRNKISFSLKYRVHQRFWLGNGTLVLRSSQFPQLFQKYWYLQKWPNIINLLFFINLTPKILIHTVENYVLQESICHILWVSHLSKRQLRCEKMNDMILTFKLFSIMLFLFVVNGSSSVFHY